MSWPVPTSVKEVRSFLGLAGYYSRFIRDYAEKAAPLHALTKKNQRFQWTHETQRAFELLKQALFEELNLRFLPCQDIQESLS